MDNTQQNERVYNQRLDFYWQSVGIFGVILLLWSMMKGTVENGSITLKINDPLTMLLASFVIISALAMLLAIWRQNRIIVGENYFILKNRFFQKKFDVENIEKIWLGREKILRRRESLRVIKIRVKSRRRLIKIKPGLFWDDLELANEFRNLKRRLTN